MIIKRQRQKTYSVLSKLKNYKIRVRKHDIFDAKAALERHRLVGGQKEADRFYELYKIHTKPQPLFKIVKK